MHKFLSILKLFLCGLIFILIFYHTIFAQKVEVKIEDGIPVVYNPKEPLPLPNKPSHLTLRKDLTLGGPREDQNHVFWLISYLIIDEDENMIVLDNGESCIKIFDKTGKKISQFGRKGEGPGEFKGTTTVTPIGDNKIGIMDPANHKFSYFSKDGQCLKEINLSKYRTVRKAKGDSQGFIYGTFFRPNEIENEVSFNRELIKFNPDFNPVVTIASFEQRRKIREVIMVEKRYGYDLRKDDFLVWGVNSEYVLHVVDTNGKIVRKIVKDYDPVKITKEERDKIYYNTFGDRKLPSDITLNFPKHFPPFHYLLCDDEGRTYVKTYKKDSQGRIFYDVFDSEGNYFTKFALLEDELLFGVKKNKAYSINRTNIPYLARYTMVWE